MSFPIGRRSVAAVMRTIRLQQTMVAKLSGTVRGAGKGDAATGGDGIPQGPKVVLSVAIARMGPCMEGNPGSMSLSVRRPGKNQGVFSRQAWRR